LTVGRGGRSARSDRDRHRAATAKTRDSHRASGSTQYPAGTATAAATGRTSPTAGSTTANNDVLHLQIWWCCKRAVGPEGVNAVEGVVNAHLGDVTTGRQISGKCRRGVRDGEAGDEHGTGEETAKDAAHRTTPVRRSPSLEHDTKNGQRSV
jgi:hypothetical protein